MTIAYSADGSHWTSVLLTSGCSGKAEGRVATIRGGGGDIILRSPFTLCLAIFFTYVADRRDMKCRVTRLGVGEQFIALADAAMDPRGGLSSCSAERFYRSLERAESSPWVTSRTLFGLAV